MSEQHELMTPDNRWQTRFLVGGAILGALIGVATAYMMVRSAEQKQAGPPQISTGDALKTVVGVIGLMRGIASLGD